MNIEPELDDFLSTHRWAVLTHLRTSGSPVSSVVAYAREGDSFVVSTPGNTFKRQALERDARVNLCTLSSSEPFNFVAVEGQVEIVSENIEASTRLVFAALEDTGYKAPDNLTQWLVEQKRVILRIQPERVHGVIR